MENARNSVTRHQAPGQAESNAGNPRAKSPGKPDNDRARILRAANISHILTYEAVSLDAQDG